MNNIEKIVQNEPLEDVISVFGVGLAYPSIDRIFVKYRFEVIANGELLKTYAKLFEDGKLANGDGPIAIKGPNWKEPNFITEKRYI